MNPNYKISNILPKDFDITDIKNNIIGQGSYGTVIKLNDELVLKYSHKLSYVDEHIYPNDASIKEICFLANHSHENIIKMYDYKFDNDYILLLLEYGGITINDWIQSVKEDELITVIHYIIYQLVSVLSYLEDLNIIHNDIKPSNILINPETLKIKLIDWGGVSFKPENRTVNYCTDIFVAPEIISDKKFSIKSDVFSIGMVIKYMLIKDYNKMYQSIASLVDKNINLLDIIQLYEKITHKDHMVRLSSKEILNLFDGKYKIINNVYIENNTEYITYINYEKNIDMKIRNILVNWMFQLCEVEKILSSVILAVWLFDKYISIDTKNITRHQIQIAACACIIISDQILNDGLLSYNNMMFHIKDNFSLIELDNMVWKIISDLNFQIYKKMFDNYINEINYNIIKYMILLDTYPFMIEDEKLTYYIDKIMIDR